MKENDQRRQDLIRLRQLLDDPQSDPVDISDCYVQILSTQLKALAKTGRAQSGRGLLKIDLRGVDLRSATGNLPIAYAPAKLPNPDWPREALELLRSYNPRREAVVLLLQDSGSLLYVID